jgi:hypothetical protein
VEETRADANWNGRRLIEEDEGEVMTASGESWWLVAPADEKMPVETRRLWTAAVMVEERR